MSTPTKYLLQESQLPKFGYNIQADLPQPARAATNPTRPFRRPITAPKPVSNAW